jgi:chromate reductase, NAD(P)H dehydrogenase (quinone)
MTTLLGISGSLRKDSFNAALLRAAAHVSPEGVSVEIGSIAGIPLYDADLEFSGGIPEAVARLKERISAADGLLLVTPEYNNSIPGVFKNAIDWLSRPPEDQARIFHHRPVGMVGATPGSFGTAFSQTAWLPTLRLLKMQIWFGDMLWVSQAMNVFDSEGKLIDESVRKRLAGYMVGFCRFAATINAGGAESG